MYFEYLQAWQGILLNHIHSINDAFSFLALSYELNFELTNAGCYGYEGIKKRSIQRDIQEECLQICSQIQSRSLHQIIFLGSSAIQNDLLYIQIIFIDLIYLQTKLIYRTKLLNYQILIYLQKPLEFQLLMQGRVDLNSQIRLTKIPNSDYPTKQTDIFQLKFIPPVPIDNIKDGQVVVKITYISIDATMRTWINGLPSYVEPVKVGDVMNALAVGQVIYSKGEKIQKGDIVLGFMKWEKFCVLKEKLLTKLPKNIKHPEQFLGALGISGLTAYFGLNKIGKLKKGEIVVVSAAAGAVGQVVIQYAKSKQCVVCGIAGSDEKCDFIKSLGADFTINYKKNPVKDALKNLFKGGVDVYFDNVGGQMLDDVLMHIKDESRIILCGAISNYTYIGANQNSNDYYRLKNYPRLIIKRATMKGFIYFDYKEEFPEAIKQLSALMADGKLKFRIDYVNGFQECPNALAKLLKGQNIGKVIVRVYPQNPTSKL